MTYGKAIEENGGIGNCGCGARLGARLRVEMKLDTYAVKRYREARGR